MPISAESIASAIATRFSSANITPPSGYTNIRTATEQLPQQLGATPAVLVLWDGEGDHEYPPSSRTVPIRFIVRFFYDLTQDNPRVTLDLLKWRDALYTALDGQTHLGLSSYVTNAVVTAIGKPGTIEYADQSYAGFDITVTVYCWEAPTFVA
jgi:hypothetical protein